MARKTSTRDFSPILNAARIWIDTCLIEDRSLFSDKGLWTGPLASELKKFFVDAEDLSSETFIEKLRNQLKPASKNARLLMAEILWALSLFPSNSGPAKKREHFEKIWELGGQKFQTDHALLSDSVLAGIGSAGTAYLTQHWREANFLILLLIQLKSLSQQDRRQKFASIAALSDWIETAPDSLQRQFPHMLRYFAFPDEVERIASTPNKRKILEGFDVPVGKDWKPSKLDQELLKLRKRLEKERPGVTLDFYDPPLEGRWQNKGSDNAQKVERIHEEKKLISELQVGPTNLILYGPPGTGKTYKLQELQAAYTETPQAQDRDAWLQALVADFGWRAVIAATLDSLGSVAVPAIRAHELIQAKALYNHRERNVGQTIWANLQAHTPESVEIVQFATMVRLRVASRKMTVMAGPQ